MKTEFRDLSPSSPEFPTLKALSDKISSGIPTISDDLGFTSIISYLGDIKKPIIGHNCSLDMYHLYDKFVDDLPLDIDKFKSSFSDCFPVLYDTKYIVNSSLTLSKSFLNAKHTPLRQGYLRVLQDDYNFDDTLEISSQINERIMPHQQGYELTGNASHEAGFDSLMTGVLFHKLVRALNDKHDFSYQKFFNDSFNIANLVYKNRIHLSNRYPINFGSKLSKSTEDE